MPTTMLSDILMRTALSDAILECVPLVVADLDTGEIVYATRPLETMFGYYVLGALRNNHNIDELVPDSVRAKHAGQRADFAKSPLPRLMGTKLPLDGQRRDGTIFPVEVMLSAAVIAQRRCAIAVVFDMSVRHGLVSPPTPSGPTVPRASLPAFFSDDDSPKTPAA